MLCKHKYNIPSTSLQSRTKWELSNMKSSFNYIFKFVEIYVIVFNIWANFVRFSEEMQSSRRNVNFVCDELRHWRYSCEMSCYVCTQVRTCFSEKRTVPIFSPDDGDYIVLRWWYLFKSPYSIKIQKKVHHLQRCEHVKSHNCGTAWKSNLSFLCLHITGLLIVQKAMDISNFGS